MILRHLISDFFKVYPSVYAGVNLFILDNFKLAECEQTGRRRKEKGYTIRHKNIISTLHCFFLKMVPNKIRSFLLFAGIQMTLASLFFYIGRPVTNMARDDFGSQSKRVSLFDIGMKYATDKVYAHHYENLYEKYLSHYRNTSVRLLEIGLGCAMKRGVGASAQTWREYLGPKADLHFLELNKVCGKKWYLRTGKKVRNEVLQFLNDFSDNHANLQNC